MPAPPTDPIAPEPLLDELIERFRDALGPDFRALRNHNQRMLCFLRMLEPNLSDDDWHKAIIAGMFHDTGIWTHDTFDYLDPSAEMAREYCGSIGREDWAEEVVNLVVWHHKLTSAEQYGRLTELFRQADNIDVLLGLKKFGLTRVQMRAVQAAYPDEGFHWKLMKLFARRFVTHPWNPAPMVKR